MPLSTEFVKNLKLNTPELPDEYIKRANEVLEKYKKLEEEYRSQLSPFHGRDDRMSPIRKKLTAKMREEIKALRKDFGLE